MEEYSSGSREFIGQKEDSSSKDYLFARLEKRIKYVRSSRIEASKRLNIEYKFNQRVVHVFTFIVVFLSIWYTYKSAVIVDEIGYYNDLGVLVLNFSIFVTLLTLYLNTRNPYEKIYAFQTNYMELTRLLADIQAHRAFNQELTIEKYNHFSEKYASLLAQSDNHLDVDYWKSYVQNARSDKDVLQSINVDVNELTLFEYERKLLSENRIVLFKRALLILTPILLLGLLLIINSIAKMLGLKN